MAKAEGRTAFGRRLEGALEEVLAFQRGEVTLPTRVVEAMPAGRVKEIRRSVAKSPKDFEKRFGVPARTVEGWEQGRRLDVSARQLLTAIAREPETMERLLSSQGA